MKKILAFLTICSSFILAGCFDTVQETTVNEDGSGVVVTTSDMGQLLALASQMEGSEAMKDAPEGTIDSTISMEEAADSIADLTPAERSLVRKGSLHLKMNFKENMFITKLSFPFTTAAEAVICNRLTGKVMAEVLRGKQGQASPTGLPEMQSIDDYYELVFRNGEISRTLNKEKYAKLGENEYFKMVSEASGMGLNGSNNYVINLPRPAIIAEGKGLKLSEDRKKITIESSPAAFMEDGTALEYRITY